MTARASVRIEGFAEAESELLSYPDGTVIRPLQELPHGIEYKQALMTNAKRWWWRDAELLAKLRQQVRCRRPGEVHGAGVRRLTSASSQQP